MRLSHETVGKVLGPGKRYILWTQGCDKRCEGCINPEGWALDGGYNKTVEDLVHSIFEKKDIVGITISGGEPFLQYQELKELVSKIKQESNLDIMIYSGRTYEELQKFIGNEEKDFFKMIDILIDGSYVQEQNNNAMYRGSDNQKIYCFTQKYKDMIEFINKSRNREFSFEIDEEGEVFFIGIPPTGFYEKLLEKIGEEYEW